MTDQFKWGFIGWAETVGKSAADLGRLGDDGVQQGALGRCPNGSQFSRQVGQSRFVVFFLGVGKDGRNLVLFFSGPIYGSEFEGAGFLQDLNLLAQIRGAEI